MTKPVDPYVGLSAEDRARAIAHEQNQRAIAKARHAHAKALLAPPEPAQAVRDAWAALRASRGRKGGGA